jgi:hypothetical protein
MGSGLVGVGVGLGHFSVVVEATMGLELGLEKYHLALVMLEWKERAKINKYI